MHVFDIPVRVGIYNAASCCNGFSPVRGWRFSWLGFWARGAAIGGVLRVCLAIAVTMALDGPSRMVKRPTGSGGEPSSPNCKASAGVKARHHHLQMVDGTGASSLVSLRTIAHQTARVLPDNFVHRRTYTAQA